MAPPFRRPGAMVAARRFLNLSPTFRGLLAMPRTGETRSPDSRPARGAAGRSAGSDAWALAFQRAPTNRFRHRSLAILEHQSKRREVHDRRLSRCRTRLSRPRGVHKHDPLQIRASVNAHLRDPARSLSAEGSAIRRSTSQFSASSVPPLGDLRTVRIRRFAGRSCLRTPQGA